MSGSDVGSKRYYSKDKLSLPSYKHHLHSYLGSESESRDIRSPLASSRINANVYAEINEMKRRLLLT